VFAHIQKTLAVTVYMFCRDHSREAAAVSIVKTHARFVVRFTPDDKTVSDWNSVCSLERRYRMV
jgi:hypothetical protein